LWIADEIPGQISRLSPNQQCQSTKGMDWYKLSS